MRARSKKAQGTPNSIRIIAGQWRGRRVPVMDSDGLRPTTDRVRERVFNWLMHDIAGARCLDLFAGSGALGFECLSRGASFVQFVEANPRVAACLRESLAALSQGAKSDTTTLNANINNANIKESDGFEFLQSVNEPFDLVFLDPPFQADLLSDCITALQKNNCLSEDALVYLEWPAKNNVLELPESWQIYRQGSTGQSRYALVLCSRNTV